MAFKYRLEDTRIKSRMIVDECHRHIYGNTDPQSQEIYECLRKTLFVIDDLICHLQGEEKHKDPIKPLFLKMNCTSEDHAMIIRFLIDSSINYEVLDFNELVN